MDISQNLKDTFRRIYGYDYKGKVYYAPGRVNLIGEHTDYNGGCVFPCALTRGTYAVASKRADDIVKLYSLNLKDSGVLTRNLVDILPLSDKRWSAYIMGVIWSLKEAKYNIDRGMDIVIYGDVPNGAGLSSSASVEVCTAVMLKDLFKLDDLDNTEIAKLCRRAENEYCGVSCGIMDQFASAMGKSNNAILLNTKTLDYKYVPLNLPKQKIIIVNSNIKHSLGNSAYNDRVKECGTALNFLQKWKYKDNLCDYTINELEENKSKFLNEVTYKRARHVVTENERCIEAAKALENNDLEKFGQLMKESHISLRDDYEVSCKEIDVLNDIAWQLDGVYGSRITGAGFGGCIVSIVESNKVDSFVDVIVNEYNRITGLVASLYIVDVGQGAGVVK